MASPSDQPFTSAVVDTIPPRASSVGALRDLEWSKLLGLTEQEALTVPGRARLRSLEAPEKWAKSLAESILWQEETSEAIRALERDSFWTALQGLGDPFAPLEDLERDRTLDLGQLGELRKWLSAAVRWKEIPADELNAPRFVAALAALPDLAGPLRLLQKIIAEDGTMAENASPRLAQLHAELRSLRARISETLDGLSRQFGAKGWLQGNYTDVRDGRFVLPVKISHQNEVEGLITEASASRQTVFVEPRAITPFNNQLRVRINELQEEIQRILRETTSLLRPRHGEIWSACTSIAYWDCIQAKGRFGIRTRSRPIRVTSERRFSLPRTAHPLLWSSLPPESIIRNDIDFGEPGAARALLLTGPNTGGKTVFLKTLGLAGACARTGFPFPAIDDPVVPFFDSIFADLGDPQSMEQNLSSFAGHVMKFRDILEHNTQNSLVLLDELNTATDPEEGAALGRAFLETLLDSRAMIVTTTHDPTLKALSLTEPRILAASMAFDENSRMPTYRIQLGVPGRSRALETAERLGLSQRLIERARGYLSQEHRSVDRTLTRLDRELADATRMREEAEKALSEAETAKREWLSRTETSLQETLQRTRQQLKRLLDAAQDEVRTTLKKIEESRTLSRLEQERGRLQSIAAETSARIESALSEQDPEVESLLQESRDADRRRTEEEIQRAPRPESLQERLPVGMKVRVPRWKALGTVMGYEGARVRIAMGTLNMALSEAEIEPVSNREARELRHAESRRQNRLEEMSRPAAPPSSLDLRGKRFENAMSELESWLDLAFRSGALKEVVIVTGMGSGALREGARKLLARLPYVKSFQDGGTGRGGAGATIVEFDV